MQLNKGDIIICKHNFFIPGTGITFYYFKDKKYKIIEHLNKWKEPAWGIEPLFSKEIKHQGWFTEKELIEKFYTIKYLRKKK